ncbi:MAG TPA: MFS transporter [Candidimonas sp.]|nr:MFS transporter [Candidimonas sp.]
MHNDEASPAVLQGASTHDQASQFGPLAGTLAIQVAATACVLAYPVLSPAIQGATVSVVGLFVAIVYLGAALGSIFGGRFIERYGPLRASQLSLFVQAAALCLMTAELFPWPWVGALLCGLAYGPINPASSQILARTTRSARMGLVFSLKQTGVPLGGLLAGALLPSLATALSWQAALVALAGATAAIALSCNGLRRMLDHPFVRVTPRSWISPLLAVLGDKRLRALAIVSMMFSIVQLCLSGYLMVYLTGDVGIDLIRAGILYALAQGAGIGGRLLWGYLADRTGSAVAVLLLIAFFMGSSAFMLSLVDVGWGVVPLGLVVMALGASAIGWNGVYLSEVARLAPEGQVAAMTGGALFFTFLGVVLGPPIFGWIATYMGMDAAFAWLVAPILLAIIFLLCRLVSGRSTAGLLL